MIDSALYHRLSPVNRRFQLRRLFITLAMIWGLATFAGLVLWWMKSSQVFYSPFSGLALLVVTLLATSVGMWFAFREDEGFRKTVGDIETRYPDLDASLVTAIEQRPATAHGTLGFLQQEVVRKAVYHGYQHPWNRVVSPWQLLIAPILAAFGFLAFVTVLVGPYFTPVPDRYAAASQGGESPLPLTGPGGFGIEPGDVEVERYSSLMVLARFHPDQVPANAELVFSSPPAGETVQPMVKSLDDPVFGSRISSIAEPLQYTVRFDGQLSDTFNISVFEFPKLERADVKLVFPEYTGKDEKLVQDVRRVSAIQGTRATWILALNKSIASGRLLARNGQEFQLVPDPANAKQYRVEMDVNRSAKYELQLIDDKGRKNKTPPVLSVQAAGNQPPEIRQLAPASDVEVSPLEELSLAATFWDDFGIERAGLTYSMVGKESTEVELARSIAARKRKTSGYVLAFEDLQAEPNQLLSFYFWAEDLASNGETRRVLGDIHLVTVREFESIFRQGQQPQGGQPPGGGQGGQGPQAMALVDLQREIVYAIWNLGRREVGKKVSSSFIADVGVVAESQMTAIDQLNEAAQALTDDAMKTVVEEVQQHQQATIEHLDNAVSNEDAAPLKDALSTTQAAYQALLRLRTNENEVAQQQQGGGGGGQGNRSRQQMEQLQLDSDENRYQSENQARESQESTEDRENRQVLSRLRELARRQNDLNKRIKELQSALQQAETPQEEEDIAEQLKRLQEEQQQVLRDTEELQERMERPENQSQMSEEAQKLEQARENARQSSEALEQGDATRAAAEGTRALEDLQELRDEFQNRTSGQFDQKMQQMRNEARDIEKEQQEIGDELEQHQADPQNQQQKRLIESDDKVDLEDRLDKQRSRVESIREEMKKTIEEAETFEPLLAERLYDTYRKTQQDSPEEAIESTAQSLRQGFMEDAEREQRRAAQNIEQLREGIDRAAEAVLGDETEALRRADRELQRLSGELENEMQRANADQESDDEANRGGDDQKQAEEDREGKQNGESKEGESGGESKGDSKGKSRDQQSGRGQGESNETNEPQQRGTGQSGEPNERQPRGDGSTPSLLRQPNRQEDRGGPGANPEINFDEETWADPISGDDYVEWSDRLRDVEEMVADPDLRAEAARIRENARTLRREVKRHSREPNWDLVRLKVIEPLVELQDRVHEELIRRSGKKSLVPIDRDPVPAEFENAVQKYFEQLGRGQ